MRHRKLTRTWVFAALGAVFNPPCCWAVSFFVPDEPGKALIVGLFFMMVGAIAGAFLGASLGHALSKGTAEWPRTEAAGRWDSTRLNLNPDRDPNAIQTLAPGHKDTDAIQEAPGSDAR